MVYYSAIKRNEPSNHKKKEEPSMQVANWKKPIWKGCTLCGSNTTTFWKRQNRGDSQISGHHKLEGRKGWVGRGVWRQWNHSVWQF
jgi:hypothetical protein